MLLRKPALKKPGLEFGDQQLWSASGDARLIADLGEGGEVTGTPEIPDSVVFRLVGNPESPTCQVKPGPAGKIYIDRQPVNDWTDIHHNAKLEIEAAGRPEVPVYKYTYFDNDPSGSERETATHAVKKARRKDSTIKPEDIFPTAELRKEETKDKLPPPPDDDELIIYDD